jgi:hypothetical protein
VTAAAAARLIFGVRLEAPAHLQGRAAQVADGLLDLRLPFPVESCRYVLSSPGESAADGERHAFAVRRETLAERIAELAGIDAERIVPETLALWRRYAAENDPRPDERHAIVRTGGREWTLVVGIGRRLLGAVPVAAGDAAAIQRALQAYAAGRPVQEARWFWCGPDATPAAWASFRQAAGLPAATEASRPPDPAAYLAGALALDGLLCGRKPETNLRPDEAAPAAVLAWRRRRQTRAQAAVVAGALVLLAGEVATVRSARARLGATDAAVRACLDDLAGRPVTQRGAAAAVFARQELDARLSPHVEAFAEPGPIRGLPALLRMAALRRVGLSSVRAEGLRLAISGEAAAAADVAALERALTEEGLRAKLTAVPRGAGVSFTGVATEALP